MNNILDKVSIIIPTFNREQMLLDTLRDLLKQDYENFEIIIIDQTPKQSTAVFDFVKKNRGKIKYILTKTAGSHRARNLGVKNATGRILLFVDDDVQIREKSFVLYHVENYIDSNIGLVGGRVVYDFAAKAPNNKEVGRLKYFGLKETTNFDSTKRCEIDHAYGCNFSCLKRIYLQVGGFSSVYEGNAHMEETDFSLRVKRAGYKLVFDPKPILLHIRSKSGGNRVNDIYDFRYWLVRNSTVFYLKNFPKWFFPIFFLGKYFWAIGSGLKRGDYKMFKKMSGAILDGMKDYRQI